MRLAHSPNPLIFPETNYPGVRDLTHKFRTAGGFSDFNHTSMLVPQSNLHCLSLAPALCQLYIDHYPALALYCDPSLSVSIRQPSLSFSLLSAVGEKKKTARGGLGGREQGARVMISSWNCHWFCDMLMPSLVSVRGAEWTNYLKSWQSSKGVCKTMLMVLGGGPGGSLNSQAGGQWWDTVSYALNVLQIRRCKLVFNCLTNQNGTSRDVGWLIILIISVLGLWCCAHWLTVSGSSAG